MQRISPRTKAGNTIALIVLKQEDKDVDVDTLVDVNVDADKDVNVDVDGGVIASQGQGSSGPFCLLET